MREQIADLVYPVLSHGISLREKLLRGEQLDLATEQATLKGLLRSELEAKRISDFGADGGAADASMSMGRGDSSRRSDAFFGIRYALVCWLDELFIVDSRWTEQWSERKLETSLYGTNDRAWKFWEQAKQADARTGTDALETFYLCVMLGFRGEFRGQGERLQSWVRATQVRIAKGQKQEFPVPPDRNVNTHVPPLRGREKLQKMVLTLAVFVLIFIPFLAFYVVRQLVGP
jgi:type VI secretion system protein ImpK